MDHIDAVWHSKESMIYPKQPIGYEVLYYSLNCNIDSISTGCLPKLYIDSPKP